MNFIEAINLINTNTVKSIERDCWINNNGIVKSKHIFKKYFSDVNLSICTNNINIGTYLPPIEDILASDWIITERLASFEEAIVALKSGKTIKRASVPQWTYNVSVCNFNEKEVMANDWIIKEEV